MNEKQRKVLLVVAIVLAAMILFPPFSYDYSNEYQHLKGSAGYSFILKAPVFPSGIGSQIDAITLFVQVVIVLIIGSIVWFAFKDNEKNGSPFSFSSLIPAKTEPETLKCPTCGKLGVPDINTSGERRCPNCHSYMKDKIDGNSVPIKSYATENKFKASQVNSHEWGSGDFSMSALPESVTKKLLIPVWVFFFIALFVTIIEKILKGNGENQSTIDVVVYAIDIASGLFFLYQIQCMRDVLNDHSGNQLGLKNIAILHLVPLFGAFWMIFWNFKFSEYFKSKHIQCINGIGIGLGYIVSIFLGKAFGAFWGIQELYASFMLTYWFRQIQKLYASQNGISDSQIASV